MSKNDVALRLERYDEVSAIALDRHLSTSSISTRLEDLVGNYRHDAPRNCSAGSFRKDAADRAARQRRAELSTTGLPKPPRRIRYNGRHEAQMSKVHAVLLVGVALIAMAAIGTLSLVVVTDVGYVAYQVLKPRANY